MNVLADLVRYYWQGLTEKLAGAPQGRAGKAQIKTTGYPRNHNYRVRGGRILPSFRLLLRLRGASRLYPPEMTSLLDVACCRGAYVLTAAQRPGCQRAAGIDVDETFVQTAEAVRSAVGIANAQFRKLTLQECVANLAEFGGPFHTVLLLGAYHYLFWGSQGHPDGYLDHDKILAMLATVCTGQVILAARLRVQDCPTFIRQRAAELGDKVVYSPASFLAAAAHRFDVRKVGRLGKQTLFVMRKK